MIDDPFFVHLLTDPWAPHPVVNSRNICFGGGGGGGAPTPPDYSQYISAMTAAGNTGLDRSKSLYDWAGTQGQAIQTTANTVSGRAGTVADATSGYDPSLMANWEKTYGPLYQAQAADASRMQANLPQTEEQYAGKFAADTGQAFDQAKASQTRQLQAYGLKAPGLASEALDMTSANQRAAATAAASEQGRMQARTEARNVTGQAIQTGAQLPQIGAQQAGIGLAAGNQQVNAPESAISTTAGAYQPSLGFYSAATPYMKAWGDTMSNSYNQELKSYEASQNSGGGIGAMLGTIGGGIAGSFFGPMGSSIGSSLGGAAGKALGGAAKGGMIPQMQDGGMPYAMATGGAPAGPHYVPHTASPSNGAITDDVPAHLNAGEFVFPKDVVAWRGEKWAHNEIVKARKEREQHTAASGAEPEMGPSPEAVHGGVIHTMPPKFISEGARG